MKPNLQTVLPIAAMKGEDDEDTREITDLLHTAQKWMAKQPFCESILESYFGVGIGRILAAFLFRILPRGKCADEWLWVIVGDIPPAYLVVDKAPDPIEALKIYIDEMRLWVSAVRDGGDLSEIIPVNASPTLNYAAMLESRLGFIETKVLPALNANVRSRRRN